MIDGAHYTHGMIAARRDAREGALYDRWHEVELAHPQLSAREIQSYLDEAWRLRVMQEFAAAKK